MTAGACVLRPNEATPVTVFCPVSRHPSEVPESSTDLSKRRFRHPQTSVTGRVTLELSQLRFSRIIFQYSHRAKPADEAALPPRPRQTLYLPPDLEAVRITLEEPPAGQSPGLNRRAVSPPLLTSLCEQCTSIASAARFCASTAVETRWSGSLCDLPSRTGICTSISPAQKRSTT